MLTNYAAYNQWMNKYRAEVGLLIGFVHLNALHTNVKYAKKKENVLSN